MGGIASEDQTLFHKALGELEAQGKYIARPGQLDLTKKVAES